MKKIYCLGLVLSMFLGVSQINAQTESLRDRLAKRKQQQEQQANSVPKASVRTQMANAEQTQNTDNASWVREIYRYLDVTEGRNAALIYPAQPVGDRTNLYTMIFKLMASDNLTAYDYLDGREIFTEEYKVDFKDVLERLNIPILQEGTAFSFNDYDIPSNDVIGYYLKEAWYFDRTGAVNDVKIVAICPVLRLVDDYGIGADRQPQFWIPYENLRPYAVRMPIMVSDMNNVVAKTVDDFFRLRLYDGEIYKTGNMANKILSEIYRTPEELKAAQERIESELTEFNKRLWVTNDSIYLKSDSEKGIKKEKKKTKIKRDQPKGGKDKNSGAKYSARDRRG